jgi:putative isomerase
MQTKTLWMALATVVWVTGLMVAPEVADAASRAERPSQHVPHIYGEGVLFAFSGLDGKTSSTAPVVASTVGDGIGLKFHLPREPMLRIFLPGGAGPRWQVVSNDLLVARVPRDELPLVIGFVAHNVVAGRLPSGGRISLDGGTTSAVLLRNEVGHHTYFSFAYDPEGSPAAAAAASAALNVSIESLVEARVDFFEKAPKGPEGLRRIPATTLAKAFSVMKANLYAPDPPIMIHWTTPCRWPHPYMSLWGSAFHSLGLMHLDLKLAKEALEAVYLFQAEDGFIPQQMGPGQMSETSHPPILAWAAWQVYAMDKMRDQAFLKRAFDVAQKHTVWFMKKRRLGGEPPSRKPLEYGDPLYFWKSAAESGAENSPRFDDGNDFAAVDLSAYLVNECRTLQTMAQRLGYRELAKTWGTRADRIAATARKLLWHAERRFFFDRKPDGEWIDTWTYAGLLPLWSGLADDAQAAAIKKHLLSEKFRAAAGVTTVARDDPTFKKDMWRGPVWIQINCLIIEGLRRRGWTNEADELRTKTLELIETWYHKTGTFAECYDPDNQTPPAELARKADEVATTPTPAMTDCNWTAALYADLLLRPKR